MTCMTTGGITINAHVLKVYLVSSELLDDVTSIRPNTAHRVLETTVIITCTSTCTYMSIKLIHGGGDSISTCSVASGF